MFLSSLQRVVKTGAIWSASRRWFASKKHKKILRLAKGFRGRANRCFRIAVQRVEKSWQHAYRSRKLKKRRLKALWITKINAAARLYGVPYNRFMASLPKSNIQLNRKVLANLAETEPYSFRSVLEVTRARDPYLTALKTRQLEKREKKQKMLAEIFE